MTPAIELTEEQNEAIDHVLANLGVGTQALAGPAGSGKTTLIKELIERIPGGAVVCAMTNKARFGQFLEVALYRRYKSKRQSALGS